MARIYKRRRRFRRRRIYRRRRIMRRMRSKKAEVKVMTVHAYNQALQCYNLPSASQSLPNTANFAIDLLSNISKGVENYQRIGDKIFVKKVVFKFYVYSCPANTSYSVGTFMFRPIIGSWVGPVATAVPYVFKSTSTDLFTNYTDRSNYIIHHDRVYIVPAYGDATTTTTFKGAMRLITVSLPFNRGVTFNVTGETRLSANRISLGALVSVPNRSALSTPGAQFGCFDYSMRVYYTDS